MLFWITLYKGKYLSKINPYVQYMFVFKQIGAGAMYIFYTIFLRLHSVQKLNNLLTCSVAQYLEPTLCCFPPILTNRLLRCQKKPTIEDDAMKPRMLCILGASAPVSNNWPVTRHLSEKAGLPKGLLSHLDYSSF